MSENILHLNEAALKGELKDLVQLVPLSPLTFTLTICIIQS